MLRPAFFVKFTFQFDKLRLTNIAFFIGDKFFYCRLINPRVFSEHGDGFLLAIVGLADSRPFRPRVVRLSVIRQFWHHLQLEHALAAKTDGCTYTVVSCVSASDDHDIFIFGVNEFSIGKV